MLPPGHRASSYTQPLPAQTAKPKALAAVQSLPDDATLDDAAEGLRLLAQIEEGLAQLDAGQGIPHEEVRRRFGL